MRTVDLNIVKKYIKKLHKERKKIGYQVFVGNIEERMRRYYIVLAA